MKQKLPCITSTDAFADVVGGSWDGKRHLKGKEGEVTVIHGLGWYKFIGGKWVHRPTWTP